MEPGHGLGLAVHRSFVTYVATVVEAAVDDKGNVTVPRVDIAVDCGPTVKSDRVRSQMRELSSWLGLGHDDRDPVQGRQGTVSNFGHDYQVLHQVTRRA